MKNEEPYPGSPEAIAARMRTETETELMKLAAGDSASAKYAEMELHRKRSARSERLILASVVIAVIGAVIGLLQLIRS